MPYLANIVKEIQYLPYLTEINTDIIAAISSLRLYPSVHVNTRTACRTTTLPTGGGLNGLSPVLIREGENVAFFVYAIHRRKDLHGKDAGEFRLERWVEDLPLFRDERTASWGYLPFNGGPRACLGRRLEPSPYSIKYSIDPHLTPYLNIIEEFAVIEASYTAVRLLQEYSKVNILIEPQKWKWLEWSSHQTASIEKIAKERQKMTLVLSPGDGC